MEKLALNVLSSTSSSLSCSGLSYVGRRAGQKHFGRSLYTRQERLSRPRNSRWNRWSICSRNHPALQRSQAGKFQCMRVEQMLILRIGRSRLCNSHSPRLFRLCYGQEQACCQGILHHRAGPKSSSSHDLQFPRRCCRHRS